ncbi:nicotinamidase/pyrazinamidase [Alkalispirochaeta americana]|uniref:Nicotinamidase n=1 Tax=Alkalispirochaeta americana TaxID=159291 RepID=A0A1N6QIJ3_9SPIO|nr:bifunctional nicotinamidase/pyrazinamidase [Alkalispirochaeta americana]SIQ16387.1 nicotinamidase/pyrazinamidase [Alkalispirochaeta americana]
MDALLVVDVQNDFLPGGALAVPRGDRVIPVINRIMPHFSLVIATQDWHPADHGSFASNHSGRSPGEVIQLEGLQQILWPDHCVQNTPGASFASGLDVAGFHGVVRKGSDPRVDSYSGFFDNGGTRATGLERILRDRAVTRVIVCGLAQDYCVKFTALDALRLGFETVVVEDGTLPVEVSPGDGDRALQEVLDAGGTLVEHGVW